MRFCILDPLLKHIDLSDKREKERILIWKELLDYIMSCEETDVKDFLFQFLKFYQEFPLPESCLKKTYAR